MSTGKKLRKWDDEYYIKIHELLKNGINIAKLCQLLNVDKRTLRVWAKEKPVLYRMLRERKKVTAKGITTTVTEATETFPEYVYKRLSPEVRTVWDQLHLHDQADTFEERAEALFHGKGVRLRQQLFIHAFISSNFNASEGCRMANISKGCYDKWIREDPGFADLIDEIKWHRENFVEGALFNLIASGDTAATIFASRTVNRHRGYEPKTESHVQIDTLQAQIDVDQMDLSLEDRRRIIEGIRNRRNDKQKTIIVQKDQLGIPDKN